jgi:hypothetical protein
LRANSAIPGWPQESPLFFEFLQPLLALFFAALRIVSGFGRLCLVLFLKFKAFLFFLGFALLALFFQPLLILLTLQFLLALVLLQPLFLDFFFPVPGRSSS